MYENIQNIGWHVFYLIIVDVMINFLIGLVLVAKIANEVVKAIK